MSWFVYIVRCRDSTLYCGITQNVQRRVREHNTSKKGAKYTRGRRPVKLVWYREVPEIRKACSLECDIKDMPKQDKERMVQENLDYPFQEPRR
jgi:putative endonuclease